MPASKRVRSLTGPLGPLSIAACFLVPIHGLAFTTKNDSVGGYAIFSPNEIAKLPSLQ